MKKAFITILGKGFITPKDKRAKYYLDEDLKDDFKIKKQNYTNMFPLIIDNFDDYDIVPIFTKDAKDTQKDVMKDEGLIFDNFDNNFFIKDVEEFDNIFKIINKALSLDYDEINIDLTHGFRHLPILATVSLIVNSIDNTEKIKNIFFAKEVIPRQEYEIIDLIDYLDLAKISFALANFSNNYTVANNFYFHDEIYTDLIDQLILFSRNILSNSIKFLFENENNSIEKIINQRN
jgi:CRISPR-associated DxTHG motif protein